MGLLIFAVTLTLIYGFLLLTNSCTHRAGHRWQLQEIHTNGNVSIFLYKCKNCKKEKESRSKINI